jgi:hypothetical protein
MNLTDVVQLGALTPKVDDHGPTARRVGHCRAPDLLKKQATALELHSKRDTP